MFDLDADGDDDILATSRYWPTPQRRYRGSVRVFNNDPAGFTAHSYRVGYIPHGIVCGDVADDADPGTTRRDAFLVNLGDRTVSSLSSFERGAFTANLISPAIYDPIAVSVADIDGDGLADLLVATDSTQTLEVLLGDPTARADSYGEGCAGVAGCMPSIQASGIPSLPTPFTTSFAIELGNARPFSPGALLMSLSPGTVIGPCQFLLNGADFSIGIFSNSAGRAKVPMAVSANPALAGVTLYCQIAVLDPAGGFLDLLSLTEGLKVRVGR